MPTPDRAVSGVRSPRTACDDGREGGRRPSDEELLARFVQEGDRAAFDALVTRHTGRVLRVCTRYFPHAVDAEDAAQETFVTLWRRGATFRGGAAFTTWLHRVAVNTCHDLARARARRPAPVSAADAAADVPEPVDLIAQRDLSLDLRQALLALDAPHRDAVLLRDVVGLPYADVAARLGVAEGTVKSRVHRAHAVLAGLLAGDDGTTSSRSASEAHAPDHEVHDGR